MIEYIVFLPLIGAIISGLLCRIISNSFAENLTTLLLIISAILSYFVFYDVIFLSHTYNISLLKWLDIGDLKINWGLKVDSLTAIMLVVVTTVSALVHVYSKGYMHEDPHIQRFMSYLSLFTFCMLMLVTADNFIQLFFGWEGVGLCSYLLIGFWFKKDTANNAALKAFVVNRVGDFAFVLGICSVFLIFKTLNFTEVFSLVNANPNMTMNLFGYEVSAINLICLLLFIGSMGKSAQIGLHTWLPDAMEGPTPVSALIHAATMVTAGVFLIARCSPLFEHSQLVLNIITIIGAVTCIFAATIAIVQNDIKKIIAYSTCSQLGYMFFACGLSAYNAAIFHLATHAFFKALLFLGSGSVIHAMCGEQDIRNMGGLWKKIPITYLMMWIGSLALMGVYPFAGYYSKDLILEVAYISNSNFGNFAYYLGLIAAFFTSFYSLRLIILVFHVKHKLSPQAWSKVHESPFIMTFPLILLSLGALFSGYIGEHFHIFNSENSFWHEALLILPDHNSIFNIHEIPDKIKLIPMILSSLGVLSAFIIYKVRVNLAETIAKLFKPLYFTLYNKYFFDEFYNLVFVKPIKCLGTILWKNIDIKIIDDFGPNLSGNLSIKLSTVVRKFQSGYLYQYALVTLTGLIIMISWYIIKIFV